MPGGYHHNPAGEFLLHRQTVMLAVANRLL